MVRNQPKKMKGSPHLGAESEIEAWEEKKNNTLVAQIKMQSKTVEEAEMESSIHINIEVQDWSLGLAKCETCSWKWSDPRGCRNRKENKLLACQIETWFYEGSSSFPLMILY